MCIYAALSLGSRNSTKTAATAQIFPQSPSGVCAFNYVCVRPQSARTVDKLMAGIYSFVFHARARSQSCKIPVVAVAAVAVVAANDAAFESSTARAFLHAVFPILACRACLRRACTDRSDLSVRVWVVGI